ncbi:MAG TPA: trigger factor [Acidimicrobiales bacterium]|nr:trigger factor [Acidimicrobiales bacterium]
MKTTVEPLEGNKVKLSVELDETEFTTAIDAAFRKISREVRIPGFRPGKAPRRLVEARVGLDVARQEAIRDALPGFYERALRENDIEPIAAPEIDITSTDTDPTMAFDAVVEVMPTVDVAGYGGLRVVMPNLDITEAEVDARVDRTREQFAELVQVDRPARDGDTVLIDRTISAGGESSVVEDFSYEVGSGLVTPEMDDHLRGAKPGDILKFDVHHEQLGDTSFTILVKEVREKVLPDLTDEWANEASEFDTVDELRANYRQELEAVRRLEAALSVRDKVIEALIELVDDEIPEALVAPEMERRLNQLSHRLSHQGVDLRSFLQSVGDSQDEFVTQLRTEATNAVKADLALRAVADLEGVEVAEEEVDKEIEEIGRQRKISPAAVRRELENEDNLPAVRSGIRKTKALEWLIAHTEFVDEEGQVIDRSQLTAPNFDAPDTAVAADAAVAEETVE